MSNPSTVWSQLSLPNPPAGSIPFVASDNASIVTDVVNLFYSAIGLTYTGSLQAAQLTAAGGFRQAFTDTTSTPGAVTINKPAGRVRLAAGQSSLVVTSSFAFATSIITAVLETADATLTRISIAPGAGTFTIAGNAACTGAVTVSYVILNVF